MKLSRTNLLKFPGLILIVWLIVFLVRLIPIGGEWGSLDGSTWLVILIWASVYFSAMIIGVFQGVRRKTNFNSLSRYPERLNRWIRMLSIFSIFGATLIVFEFAIVRGYGFSTSVVSIRAMEVDAAIAGFGGSWISGLGRMLTPALMVAWVLTVLHWPKVRKWTLAILFFASAFVFYQQAMFEGGRFYLAALLLMTFVASKFVSPSGARKRISIQSSQMLWGALFIFSVLIFGYTFSDRYEQNSLSFDSAYATWTEVFDLEIDSEVVSSRLSGDMAGAWLGVYMLWAYATQGLNELNVLLLVDQINQAWGLSQFPQIGQGLDKIFGFGLKYDMFQELPHVGTYITFYGASYVDFGYIGGLMFIGAIGWLTGRSIRVLRNGNLTGLAINAPLLIALGIFAPVMSLVVNLWPAFCWAFFVSGTNKIFSRRTFSRAATPGLVIP